MNIFQPFGLYINEHFRPIPNGSKVTKVANLKPTSRTTPSNVHLFSVTCLTCRRHLKVTDPKAIGAILACPGCGGMVQIAPPDGWQMPSSDVAASVIAPTTPTMAVAAPAKPVTPPPLHKPKPAVPAETVYEQVDAAVAGASPVIAAGMVAVVATPTENTPTPGHGPTGSIASPPVSSSLRYVWLGGGAVAMAIVSALIVVVIGSSSAKLPAESADGTQPALNNNLLAAVPVTEENKQSAVTPPATVGETTEPKNETPATPSPEKIAATNDRSPAITDPVDPLKANAPAPVVEKSDLDEELDSTDRSAGLAFRLGVEPIDWPARLEDKIPGVACRNLPLADYLAMLSNASNLRIAVDVDALEETNITTATPVTVKLSATNLGAALEAGLSPRGLRAIPSGRHLQIVRSGETPGPLRTVPYTVSDLAADKTALEQFSQFISKLVAPESWKSAGGSGSIQIGERSLIIEQTASNHFQIVLFCERLRLARGLPTKSRLDSALLRLESRTARASQKLSQPVTAVFFNPTPLPRILEYIGKKSGVRFLIDDRAFEVEGISPDVAGTFNAQSQPLDVSLSAMLEKMELTYRVVDDKTVQITTRKGFRREIEFYRVKELIVAGVKPEQITERITTRVVPGRWTSQGGKGAIEFDPASQTVVVSHSQLVQREVAELLVDWHSNSLAAKKTPAEK